MRKTIEVETVKSVANNMLANSVDEMTDGRIAIAILLERILIDTGNYHGFRYLQFMLDSDGNATFGDETRRQYY